MPENGLLPGAEPWSAEGGPIGVVCLHNFTAHPGVMRAIGERLAGEGCTVDVPLLSGHGRSVHDIVPFRWSDFLKDATAALERVQARAEQVFLVGSGCGGMCAVKLASTQPGISGVAAISTPTGPFSAKRVASVERVVAAGGEIVTDGPGASDINKSDGHNVPKEGTPARTFLSLHAAACELDLTGISCPVIGFYARGDRTLLDAWSHGERLRAQARGPVELVELRNSGHIATVDYDARLIEDRVAGFIRRVASGGGTGPAAA
jgi:carboxylesterase